MKSAKAHSLRIKRRARAATRDADGVAVAEKGTPPRSLLMLRRVAGGA